MRYIAIGAGAVGGPVPSRPDDVLILATKPQDTPAAIDGRPRDLPAVCAQNGVADERALLRHFRASPT
ncbi:hypothetical protein [Nonomuraea sp. NPDC050783]|uniref:hypothetical protein n=1 Tax=Nonomuraea sp. NPDC050783 TaxID=3154634 RepID=UPI0034660415